jgi:hypothetical protein
VAHLDIRTFISTPPELVWDVISNLERQKDWMVDLRRLEITRISDAALVP